MLPKLKKLWQQKLKDSGFVDIENEKGLLHSWDSFRFSKIDPNHFEDVQEKYLEATQFPQHYEITNPVERTIWELYSNGRSYREIAKEVKSIHQIPYNKDYVQKVVWKLNSILCHLRRKDEEG